MVPAPPPGWRSLLVTDARGDELRRDATAWRSWTVAGRTLTDLEALVAGFLWPLRGYTVPGSPLGVVDAPSASELIVPLWVSGEVGRSLDRGEYLALRDPEGVLLAALRVEERFEQAGGWLLGGPLEGVELPSHDDFVSWRMGPDAAAARVQSLGYRRVLAFFAGNVLHAATRAALIDAATHADAALLLLIGSEGGEHDDLADFAKVRALHVSAGYLPRNRTVEAIVPFPRPGSDTRGSVGSEESAGLAASSASDAGRDSRLAHAILFARNCGATILAIDSANAVEQAVSALRALVVPAGIELLTLRRYGYSRRTGHIIQADEPDASGVQLPPTTSEVCSDPAAAPEWLLERDERDALARAYVPRAAQGFTVFFTGLSGSGKSTIARALRVRLMELTGRPVTLLDGDRVRRHLSSELGFSREHRNLNILRIGWVAAELSRHGGIAICAPIAPYDAIRREVQQMVEAAGGFILVHVSTPLETCEARDRKGLYARARSGQIPQFTGVSDVYEPPANAALTMDTRETSVEEACRLIVDVLTSMGYLERHS